MGNTNGRQFGALAKKDIERLQRRFLRASGGKEYAQIIALQQLPELAGNPFIPRIFQLFDANGDGIVTLDEFTRGVEYLATLSDPEEQYKFAFSMYDANADGVLTQADLYSMLKTLGAGNMSDAQLEQVVQSTIEEFDKDGDRALSLAEFKNLVHSAEIHNKLAVAM